MTIFFLLERRELADVAAIYQPLYSVDETGISIGHEVARKIMTRGCKKPFP